MVKNALLLIVSFSYLISNY